MAQIAQRSYHFAPTEKISYFDRAGNDHWIMATALSHSRGPLNSLKMYYLDDKGNILWTKFLDQADYKMTIHCSVFSKEANLILAVGCSDENECLPEKKSLCGLVCIAPSGKVIWQLGKDQLPGIKMMAFNADSTALYACSTQEKFKIDPLTGQFVRFGKNVWNSGVDYTNNSVVANQANPKQILFVGSYVRVYEDTTELGSFYLDSTNINENTLLVFSKHQSDTFFYSKYGTPLLELFTFTPKGFVSSFPLDLFIPFKDQVGDIILASDYVSGIFVVYDQYNFFQPVSMVFTRIEHRDWDMIFKLDGGQVVCATHLMHHLDRVEIHRFEMDGSTIITPEASEMQGVKIKNFSFEGIEHVEWVRKSPPLVNVQFKDCRVEVSNESSTPVHALSLLGTSTKRNVTELIKKCNIDSIPFRYYDKLSLGAGQRTTLSLGPVYLENIDPSNFSYIVALSAPNQQINPTQKYGRTGMKIDPPIYPDQFQIFPNPAEDRLTITIPLINYGAAQFAIYNALGQIVMEGITENTYDYYHINIQNLAKGCYWLQIGKDKAKFVKI